MNPAEIATSVLIEETLKESPAYRKIGDALFAVKQGSTFVLIHVVPWSSDRALCRCVAQMVKGIHMTGAFALDLLELNAYLRLGAFAYDRKERMLIFLHSILGGDTLDKEELLATVRDVAVIADEYDDKIIKRYGGQTMKESLADSIEVILRRDVNTMRF